MSHAEVERIWERFLTENDRRHLAATRDRRVGFGERPALLLVDLYRGVFGDRPQPLLEAITTWPASCGLAAWEALPRIQTLLAAAREVRIPVIHVTGLAEAGMPGWNEAIHGGVPRSTNAPAGGDPAARERERRRYEIVDEVAPVEGEVVLRKSAPSAFWGTPLIGQLIYLGVDTLIVAGESTSGCVRATVVDGASHRLRMIVVAECVFDRHEAAHAINLFDMHQKYADVLPLADVLAYLRQVAARRAAS